MALRHVRRARRRTGRRPREALGHDAERHRQGVPVARHVHLPAGGVAPAHRRPDLPHGSQRPELEPDQRLPVPLPGGGRDPGAGDRVRARDRLQRPRCGARLRSDPRGRVPAGGGAHLVLRRRGSPLRRGALQDARLHRALGADHARALRRHRSEAAAVPLRDAGELARAHRGAAREQRPADRARDARRDALEGRPRPGDPAAVLERGPRSPDAVGPAVVAPDAAGPRVRDRPARVRRPLRRVHGRRGEDRRARGSGIGRARVGARRWRGVRDDRCDEGPPGPEQRRAGAAHRVGRADRGGRELLHRDRAVTPRVARLAALDRGRRPGRRAGADRAPAGVARGARRSRGARGARRGSRRRAGFGEPRARPPSRSPEPAAPSASGPERCATCSASTAPRRVSAQSPCRSATSRPSASASRPRRSRWAGSSGCSSASPVSTVTRTAPSRSRWPPATPASRSSTRGSA